MTQEIMEKTINGVNVDQLFTGVQHHYQGNPGLRASRHKMIP